MLSRAKDQAPRLTATAIANDAIQHGDKIRDDMVHVIKSGKNGDDVGAGIGILLPQDAG